MRDTSLHNLRRTAAEGFAEGACVAAWLKSLSAGACIFAQRSKPEVT